MNMYGVFVQFVFMVHFSYSAILPNSVNSHLDDNGNNIDTEGVVNPTFTLQHGALEDTENIIGKTMDLSNLVQYTEGVKMTLGGKPVDFNAFTLDELDMKIINRMRRGRSIENLMYVAAKLAGIEVKMAAYGNKIITSVAIEDLFDPADDMVLNPEDIDELEREINEDPSVLDLDHTDDLGKRTKRKATSYTPARWPNAVVPFFITSDFDNDPAYTQAIMDGIRHWEEETCLVFRDLKGQETYSGSYVLFWDDVDCYSSYIGRANFGQVISIGRRGNCGTMGVVAHEIGHALGMYHEQSRPDRDLYVRVNTENINPMRLHNFMKRTWTDSMTAGVPYDYASVMHYGLSFFTENGADTLSVLEQGLESVPGHIQRLSFYDIKLANNLYCQDRCQGGLASSECENDGYRDPKDCTRCKCPEGWTGSRCTEVQPAVNAECGDTDLMATDTWQVIRSPRFDSITSPNSPAHCTWRIKAPSKDQRVVVKMQGYFSVTERGSGYCYRTCLDYLEVRSKVMSKTGPRFCCSWSPNREFTSEGDGIMLLLRTRRYSSNNYFTLTYKIESEQCGCSPDSSTVPACVKTQSYSCNVTYTDCTTGPCTNKIRHNTCYKEELSCCNGFQLKENICHGTAPSWRDWSGWSGCSVTCGGGSRQRSRTCNEPPCSGPSTEGESCNEIVCPAPVSSWTAWTACSSSCGTGHRIRWKPCFSPDCGPTVFEHELCQPQKCPERVSDWSAWTSCTVTCGSGSRSRARDCHSASCSATTTENEVCNTMKCFDQWTIWGGWSDCSRTCGSGARTRTRECVFQPCSGPETETGTCNTEQCPEKLSDWSIWSSCSSTCGSGYQYRGRTCKVSACSEPTVESQQCKLRECSAIGGSRWSDWTRWSGCSQACGGYRIRSRACVQQPCSGETYETEMCNTTC